MRKPRPIQQFRDSNPDERQGPRCTEEHLQKIPQIIWKRKKTEIFRRLSLPPPPQKKMQFNAWTATRGTTVASASNCSPTSHTVFAHLIWENLWSIQNGKSVNPKTFAKLTGHQNPINTNIIFPNPCGKLLMIDFVEMAKTQHPVISSPNSGNHRR